MVCLSYTSLPDAGTKPYSLPPPSLASAPHSPAPAYNPYYLYIPLIEEHVLGGSRFIGYELGLSAHAIDCSEYVNHYEIDMSGSLGVYSAVFVATVPCVRLAVVVIVVDCRDFDVALVLYCSDCSSRDDVHGL